MKKPPKFRDIFLNEYDELNYLNDMICFYKKHNIETSIKLKLALKRFSQILSKVGLDDGSIMLQDHWVLLHESEGRFMQAIEHREREVERIEQLFSIGGPVGPINIKFFINALEALYQNYLHLGNTYKSTSVINYINKIDIK